MKITNIITSEGINVINIEYDDGVFSSMLKSAWDELQAQTNRIGVVTNGDN